MLVSQHWGNLGGGTVQPLLSLTPTISNLLHQPPPTHPQSLCCNFPADNSCSNRWWNMCSSNPITVRTAPVILLVVAVGALAQCGLSDPIYSSLYIIGTTEYLMLLQARATNNTYSFTSDKWSVWKHYSVRVSTGMPSMDWREGKRERGKEYSHCN